MGDMFRLGMSALGRFLPVAMRMTFVRLIVKRRLASGFHEESRKRLSRSRFLRHAPAPPNLSGGIATNRQYESWDRV